VRRHGPTYVRVGSVEIGVGEVRSRLRRLVIPRREGRSHDELSRHVRAGREGRAADRVQGRKPGWRLTFDDGRRGYWKAIDCRMASVGRVEVRDCLLMLFHGRWVIKEGKPVRCRV
jgi:hypothetical protein